MIQKHSYQFSKLFRSSPSFIEIFQNSQSSTNNNPSRQEIATVQSRSNSSLDKGISLFLNHRVDQDAYTQKETKRSEPRRWPRLEEEQEGLAEERQEGEGERQEGGKVGEVRRRGREADVGA